MVETTFKCLNCNRVFKSGVRVMDLRKSPTLWEEDTDRLIMVWFQRVINYASQLP